MEKTEKCWIKRSNEKAYNHFIKKGYKIAPAIHTSSYVYEEYYGCGDPSNVNIERVYNTPVYIVEGFVSKRAFHRYLKENGLLLSQQ